MGIWYEVTVKHTKTFAVEMEHEDENAAVQIVIDDINGEFDEIEGEAIEAGDVASLLRHTDKDKILSL